MDEHLGYQKNQVSDTSNSRNGYSNKTIKGDHGEVKIAIPRDRESSFEPLIVKKGKTRLTRSLSDLTPKTHIYGNQMKYLAIFYKY